MPIRRSSGSTHAPSPATGRPAIAIEPASGASKPAIARSSVVLPEPLGPSSATSSPWPTARVAPSTARVRPNRFSTARASMASSDPDTSDKVALMKRFALDAAAGRAGGRSRRPGDRRALAVAAVAARRRRRTSSSTTAARSTATSRRSRRSRTQTGLEVELRGGTAPELFERLDREGDETEADLLVTTDLANLWRAKEAGLLEPVESDGAEQPGRRRPARPRRRVVGPEHAHPHADALDRARRRGRGPELRGPRRPAVPRAACACARATTSTTSRSSPTASPSTARPRPRSCCAPGWPTSRRSSAPTSTCSTRSPPAAATSA